MASEAFRTLSDKLRGLPAPGGGAGHVSDETRRAHAAALARASKTGEDKEVVILIKGQARARWKIEVTFLSNRSLQHPCAYKCEIWESGKHLNGEGDALAWWCLDSDPRSNDGCRAIIPQDAVKAGIALCPSCKRAINAERLTNATGGNVRMDSLATYLANLFRKLGSNADIYLKYFKTDPRYIALERAKGPDVAKKLQGLHIYPLHRMLTDLAAGADLTKRIKAFLTS